MLENPFIKKQRGWKENRTSCEKREGGIEWEIPTL